MITTMATNCTSTRMRINMMRGGSPNRSQKLMRMRVLVQFVAIVVIMATIWLMQR